MSYRNNTNNCVGFFVKKTYLKETYFTVECNYSNEKYNLSLYECKPTADIILLEDYGQYKLYKIVCDNEESLIAPGLSIGIYQDITELSNIQINEQKINYNNHQFSVLLKNESSTRVPSFYLQNSTHILYGDCQIAGNNKKAIECSYNNLTENNNGKYNVMFNNSCGDIKNTSITIEVQYEFSKFLKIELLYFILFGFLLL